MIKILVFTHTHTHTYDGWMDGWLPEITNNTSDAEDDGIGIFALKAANGENVGTKNPNNRSKHLHYDVRICICVL